MVLERHKFRQRAQLPDESVDAFVNGLRELAKSCDFGALENDMIRDQIVEKCAMKKLRDKLLQEDGLVLDKALSTARAFEAAQTESRLFSEASGHRARDNQVHFTTRRSHGDDTKMKPKAHGRSESRNDDGEHDNSDTKCFRCGMSSHREDECGARTATCLYCKKNWTLCKSV